MTKDEMLLAIDRLTRFKFPEIKYNRVFKEIIAKYLITPKISFKAYDTLSDTEIRKFIEAIFNESIKNQDEKHNLLEEIKNQTESLFTTDESTSNLLNVQIPYETILNLFSVDDLCQNLKFLKLLCTTTKSKTAVRKEFETKFPIEKVVLAEGITEEILLPKFAKILGYDFNKHGIEIIAAGGKNQVAKDYINLLNRLNVPIIILLDADAKKIADKISEKLREQDKLILIEKGEFEDILPLKLLKKVINYKYKNLFSLTVNDFSSDIGRVKDLEEIYRTNGLGEFKKAEFAHNIDKILKLTDTNFVSEEIKAIIEEIKSA